MWVEMFLLGLPLFVFALLVVWAIGMPDDAWGLKLGGDPGRGPPPGSDVGIRTGGVSGGLAAGRPHS